MLSEGLQDSFRIRHFFDTMRGLERHWWKPIFVLGAWLLWLVVTRP
jgi:hypothetical protein